MPNLNGLADRSTVFARAYCPQPICAPCRGSILTGLWPTQHGLVENNLPLSPEAAVLPELLPPGERLCAHFGKWHLGDELFAQRGFTEWVSIEDQYNDYFGEGRDRNTRSSYHYFLVGHGLTPENGRYFSRLEAAALPEKLSKPQFLASEAERFFESRAADREPFVLFVSFLEPHPPNTGPLDAEYDWQTIQLPESLDDGPDTHHNPKAWLNGQFNRRRGKAGFPLRERDDWKRHISRYWGLCTQIDNAVGRILGGLSNAGLADDTIVVFTSDHGDQLGAHGTVSKGLMYEESCRIPLLIHLPGQTTQRFVDRPVSQVDLVPTLLELLGVTTDRSFPGRSLVNDARGTPAGPPDDVFIQWTAQRLRLAPVDKPNSGIWDEMLQIGTGRFGRDLAEAAISQDIRTVVSSDGRWKLNHSSRYIGNPATVVTCET
jgi:arylsulfatase A-like enzyme